MRATLGERFKILLLDAGLSPEQAAKELHVSPRTIRYWISGKVLVPYAAFRLLRILRLFELPCKGWDGWHMHSGKLWSPEGFSFEPHDANWWSLLVRRADGFGRQYTRANQLDVALQRLASAGDAVAAAGLPAQAGLPAVGMAAPEKEGKPVTPSFFPVERNFCLNFKQAGYAYKPGNLGIGGGL